MKILFAFLLLVAVVASAHAVDKGEITALESLLSLWPTLAQASPPWTSNVSQACEAPGFYGLTCSTDHQHIIELNFSGSSLRGALKADMEGLSFLRKLILENVCLLGSLPPEITSLTKLTHLEVSIPVAMACQSPFDTARLSLPTDIGNLRQLEVISLRGPLFGVFPDSIGKLTSLKRLELELVSEAKVTSISGRLPPDFSNLVLLEELSFNQLFVTSTVAPTLLRFPKLRKFTFIQSSRSSLPVSMIASSPELEELHLIGPVLVGFIDPVKFPKLTVLEIESSTLNGSVKIGSEMKNLRTVRLISNRFSVILDQSIGQLTDLNFLSVVSTPATGFIPASICDCRALTTLQLEDTRLSGSLPLNLGQLTQLTTLIVKTRGRLSGTVPESIGELTNLRFLHLSYNALTGTLPSSMRNLRVLKTLFLNSNKMSGPIPSMGFVPYCLVDLSHNQFTGTVPSSLAQNCESMILAHNQLGPYISEPETNKQALGDVNKNAIISNGDFALSLENTTSKYSFFAAAVPQKRAGDPSDIFASNEMLHYLDLSHNHFVSQLPFLPNSKSLLTLKQVHMQSNNFYGGIPSSYCYVKVVDLSRNVLSKFLNEFLACADAGVSLEGNRFTEELVFPTSNTKLLQLDLSNNQLNSTNFFLNPELPPNLLHLYMTGNRISADVGRFADYLMTHPLSILDLSDNNLICFERNNFHYLFMSNLTNVNLASNSLACRLIPISEGRKDVRSKLVGLELQNNQLSGEFFRGSFPSLVSVNLANNSFSSNLGGTSLPDYPSLTQLNISQNTFSFDVSRLSFAPYLISLDVSNNQIFGTIDPNGWPNVLYADLRKNNFDDQPVFPSIGKLFADNNLQLFKMSENPGIRPFDLEGLAMSGLLRTAQSSPAIDFEGGVCYQLAFQSQRRGGLMDYDEGLFQYAQCDCDSRHFGAPPLLCYPCPKDGASSCGGKLLEVPKNYFTFTPPLRAHTNSIDFPVVSRAQGPRYPIIYEVETCIYTPLQALSGRTNCKGLNITDESVPSSLNETISILATQCNEGSEGRLCSKCKCDPTGRGDCWYLKGPTCRRCGFAFTPTSSIAVVVTIFVAIEVVLSVVMFFALRSKRSPKVAQPHLFKRIFYRLHFMTSLGTVSIVITFLQLLLQLTNWDAYALRAVLDAMNGSIELRCIFPVFSHPLASLLWRLSIPFIAVLLVISAVAIAELASRILNYKSKPTEDGESESESLLMNDTSSAWTKIDYPATAIATSSSLTVIKFFYFGTAISAHEYVFATRQAYTGLNYVQNHPWILYSDAMNLIGASIPVILIFDIILPVAYLVLCWKMRHSFHSPGIQIYFGTLFETFSRPCFWWEMVNIIKKLSIALVLRGIAASNAFQMSLVMVILALIQFMQVWLQPWKRKAENLLDTLSALLLIGSALASRSPHLANVYEASILFVVISALYTVICAGTVIYQTWTVKLEYEIDGVSTMLPENSFVNDKATELDAEEDPQASASESDSSFIQ